MFDSISLFLVHSQLPNTVKNKVCFQTKDYKIRIINGFPIEKMYCFVWWANAAII